MSKAGKFRGVKKYYACFQHSLSLISAKDAAFLNGYSLGHCVTCESVGRLVITQRRSVQDSA